MSATMQEQQQTFEAAAAAAAASAAIAEDLASADSLSGTESDGNDGNDTNDEEAPARTTVTDASNGSSRSGTGMAASFRAGVASSFGKLRNAFSRPSRKHPPSNRNPVTVPAAAASLPAPATAGGGGSGSNSPGGPARRPTKQTAVGSSASSAKPSSSRKLKAWFRACRKKHLKEMTPELRARMHANAARQEQERRVWQKVRKAKKMEYASKASRSATMRSWAAGSRSEATLRSVGLTVSAAPAARSREKARASHTLARTLRVLASRCSSSDDEDDIAALEVEAAVEEQSMDARAIAGVIAELRTEPATDAERGEKFATYETYLAAVEKSRRECLAFHTKCLRDLAEHGAILANMAKAIRSIDAPGNTAIDWDHLGGRWFVHDMTRKSDANNAFIGKVFTGLKRDLELVSNDDMDCPICLENLTAVPSGVRVLRCCHKLCGDCYDNWRDACVGGKVVCPMCRQQDFQEALVARSHVQSFLRTMHSDSEDSDDDGGGGGGGGAEEAGASAAPSMAASPVPAPATATAVAPTAPVPAGTGMLRLARPPPARQLRR